MSTWQLQTAKARLSEVLKHALEQGPQAITLHRKPVAVLVSQATYDQLVQRGDSLTAFMQHSPLAGTDGIFDLLATTLAQEAAAQAALAPGRSQF